MRQAPVSLLLASLAAAPAAADVITNGSFASGLTSWSAPGAPAVVYTTVTSTRDATNAIQVSARTQADHAPRQNLLTNLVAGGPGVTYTTRFWISLLAPASVRCYLNLNDANGARQELIAEQVVRSPNVWTAIEGTRRLDWVSPLTAATLSFAVERVSEGVYPDLVLDDVSMEVDSDGDGLTDPEETGLGTSISSRDSDSDGLPDTWEHRVGLDPTTAETVLDADLDSFTNREEYWAATSPTDPSSRPAEPSNPAANASARAVLRYLALLPSRDSCKVVAGQHLSYPAAPNDEYAAMIDGLHQQVGKYPGLLSLQYDDGANPVQIAAVNPYAIDYWNQGGLVLIKWNPLNPWTRGFYNDRTYMGFDDVITPGSTANTNYLLQLDQVAAGLRELRDLGVVVLWRLCSEMNGAWFWWGRRDQKGYVDFWRYTHAYLTSQGLDNLLWVYESDSNVHGGCASDYYYPGDDVVDVMGHNFYNDSYVLPFDAELLYRRYPKVYAFPQAGPQSREDGTWSNLTYLHGDPAGQGGIRNLYPRASFFAAWNSFTTWDPVLMRSVFKAKALVDNAQASELVSDPLVVTREEVAWSGSARSRVSPLKVVKLGATSLSFTWPDVSDASDYVVLEDPSPRGTFALTTGVATSGNPGLATAMPAGDVYYRVAGRTGCGLGPID